MYPRLVKNPKYLPNKKNGGNVPFPKDGRALYVPIECKECIDCRKKRANEWRIKLFEDIKVYKNGKFVTLTFRHYGKYSLDSLLKECNDNLPYYGKMNAVATLAVRRFLERHRKKFNFSPRHWFVTELGHNGTERIHLHGILYTDLDNTNENQKDIS